MGNYDIEIKKIKLNETDKHICNFILSEKFESKNSDLEIIFKYLLLNNEEDEAFSLIVCALYAVNISLHCIKHSCPMIIYKDNKELLKKKKLNYVKIYRSCTDAELIKFVKFTFNISLKSIKCEEFFDIYSNITISCDKTFWAKVDEFFIENFNSNFQNSLEFDNKPSYKRMRSSNSSKINDSICDISFSSFYEIYENRDNFCLIFNNDQRKGSEVDVNTIKQTFGAIKGFNIKDEKITSKDKFNRDLKKYTDQISSNSDMIICFFMSHGEEGLIRCPNDDSILINDIIEFFTVKNVRNLAGKPKIFIFQACRGTNEQEVLQFDSPTGNVDETPINKTPISEETLNLSDWFFVYSTSFGCKSLRDTVKGSYFIRSFCESVRKYSKIMSIDEICTFVNKCYPKIKNDDRIISQVCEIRKSLLKFHVFLEKPTERTENNHR